MPYEKKVAVTQDRLREMYARQFEARIDSGQLTLNEYIRRPPYIGNNLPQGTMSILYEIIDNQGHKVGMVHAMILPDGNIGGSGRYDPKSLLVGRTLYTL